MRWLWWILVVLVVMSFAFQLTDIDPRPSGFACASPLIEVTADSPRVKGTVIERQFGCTFYFYETTGAD
jgi:hypothetical protein